MQSNWKEWFEELKRKYPNIDFEQLSPDMMLELKECYDTIENTFKKILSQQTKQNIQSEMSMTDQPIKYGDITFEIKPQTSDVSNMKDFLKQEWCTCEESEFLCYPKDGCCTCGEYKHHVHCKKCGGISQTG